MINSPLKVSKIRTKCKRNIVTIADRSILKRYLEIIIQFFCLSILLFIFQKKLCLWKFPCKYEACENESNCVSSIEMEETKDGVYLRQNVALRVENGQILMKHNSSSDNKNKFRRNNDKLHERIKQVDKIAAIVLPLLFLIIGIAYWIGFYSHRYSFL